MTTSKNDPFDAQAYWRARSDSYRQTMDTPYHRNRLAMIARLIARCAVPAAVVDFGCGDGVHAAEFAAAGARLWAIDVDAEMAKTTRERLSGFGGDNVAIEGGAEALRGIPSESVDLVLGLNVLAYLSPEDEKTFYTQARRVLKRGAKLVVTHSNELFDMFTLNKYTVSFFARHFGVPEEGVKSLLANHDVPQRFVFPVRENPLAYARKLGTFGFAEEAQEFAILHPLPPLLMREVDPDALDQRDYPDTLDWPPAERWKLMFQCSIFGSVSVRQ
jgi:ubiquinone/menaquinone biosynthesis C-methylase UbiE